MKVPLVSLPNKDKYLITLVIFCPRELGGYPEISPLEEARHTRMKRNNTSHTASYFFRKRTNSYRHYFAPGNTIVIK